MKEEVTRDQQMTQQKLLSILVKVSGKINFWIPEKCIPSIIPHESGGCQYVFNVSMIGIFNQDNTVKPPNNLRKLDIFINNRKKVLFQFPNGKTVTELPCPHGYFEDIEDLEKNVFRINESISP